MDAIYLSLSNEISSVLLLRLSKEGLQVDLLLGYAMSCSLSTERHTFVDVFDCHSIQGIARVLRGSYGQMVCTFHESVLRTLLKHAFCALPESVLRAVE